MSSINGVRSGFPTYVFLLYRLIEDEAPSDVVSADCRDDNAARVMASLLLREHKGWHRCKVFHASIARPFMLTEGREVLAYKRGHRPVTTLVAKGAPYAGVPQNNVVQRKIDSVRAIHRRSGGKSFYILSVEVAK